MPRSGALTDDEVRRMRLAAQHLHRPRRRSAADLVRHLGGVQAQVLSAAGMALGARTDGLTAEGVDRARLRDRSIVLAWAMRGTLHLVAAEDHGWLVPLVVEPRVANAYRRLAQEGVPADRIPVAVRLVERMLERDGPLTRPEIEGRLHREGVHTQGQAMAHLAWLASAQGLVCHGPDRGAERRLVLVRDWLGRPESPEPMEREAALAELAVRYLRGHGPAVPADLAAWSGLRASDATRAWRRVQDRLVEVPTRRGPRWDLRSSHRSHRSHRPAASEPASGGGVRLLPAFDEYLLGWKERDLVATAERWRRINRGGGWLRPVVLSDGRAVGLWALERRSARGRRLEVEPFSPVPPAIRRGVASEAERLAAFLGAPVEVDLEP
jgi:Winged helix DNA-binding domain